MDSDVVELMPEGVHEIERTDAPGLFEAAVFVAEFALSGVAGAAYRMWREGAK